MNRLFPCLQDLLDEARAREFFSNLDEESFRNASEDEVCRLLASPSAST
jgi:hypothetical protein